MLDITYLNDKYIVEVIASEPHDIVLFCGIDFVFKLHHEQDCCENVYIHEIVGDLDDLSHATMISAECVEETIKDDDGDAMTATFYKFQSNKGNVTITWYGESNGYYSESVDYQLYIPKTLPKDFDITLSYLLEFLKEDEKIIIQDPYITIRKGEGDYSFQKLIHKSNLKCFDPLALNIILETIRREFNKRTISRDTCRGIITQT